MYIIVSIRITALIIFALIFVSLYGCSRATDPRRQADFSAVERAIEQRQRDVQVEGEGVVTRVLADDVHGSRHQRFIIRLRSGQTLLIQHNIDLAQRIPDLKEGDAVGFFGEYIWNEQGGLIHWTHHDPSGHHVAGWLRHNGQNPHFSTCKLKYS